MVNPMLSVQQLRRDEPNQKCVEASPARAVTRQRAVFLELRLATSNHGDYSAPLAAKLRCAETWVSG